MVLIGLLKYQINKKINVIICIEKIMANKFLRKLKIFGNLFFILIFFVLKIITHEYFHLYKMIFQNLLYLKSLLPLLPLGMMKHFLFQPKIRTLLSY